MIYQKQNFIQFDCIRRFQLINNISYTLKIMYDFNDKYILYLEIIVLLSLIVR